MKDTVALFESIVNSSGFGLQLAIAKAVEATSAQHGFCIEAREHPWRRGSDSGFIDLIVGRATIRLVCECKRTRDANWVFLVDDSAEPTNRARVHWVKRIDEGVVSGWNEAWLTTQSPESAFCIVRGKGENDKPSWSGWLRPSSQPWRA